MTYKDYADGCRRKELTLPAVELLRRFALHVLPGGFVRIRHYGLLTHRSRGARLARCRALLAGVPAVVSSSSPLAAVAVVLTAAAVLAAAAGAAPATRLLPSDTLSVAASLAAVVSDELCRNCRQGRRETFWLAERPRGRDFERHWVWNTS